MIVLFIQNYFQGSRQEFLQAVFIRALDAVPVHQSHRCCTCPSEPAVPVHQSYRCCTCPSEPYTVGCTCPSELLMLYLSIRAIDAVPVHQSHIL